MSQDFVKQLQMAKQLEQKAKEAAKGREAAEAKIQEATGLLVKVKEMSASSAETEKLLTLASQSYSDKDYKEALSYAVKSVDASLRSRKERLQGMLRETASLLERVSPLGKMDEGTDKALKNASEAIEANDLEEAYELSREAWDTAERNANRVLSEAFGQAQSSLLFAEKLGLKVDKQRVALSNCREALESGDAGKSVELIDSLLGALTSMTLDLFVERRGRLEALFSLEGRLPLRLDKARESVAKGQELIARSDVEKAFTSLDSAEESFSRAFSKSAGARIKELQARAEEMSSLQRKVQLGDLEGGARRLELEERYAEAITVLEDAREKVREAEKEVLLKRMAVMQPRLKLAHLIKKDVSLALQKMEEARKALKDDDLKAALSLAEEARLAVEERLQGYDEVEAELQTAQELRSRCEDLGLGCAEGAKAMVAARHLALKGDFAQATETLRGSQRSFRLSLENHFATGIMRLEMKMATAIRLGADVSEESKHLENLTAKVRKGDFELVAGSLITIDGSVEERAQSVVGEEIERTETLLNRYTDLPEVERARGSLATAREKLLGKDFQGAHDLIGSLMTRLMAEMGSNLDRSLQEGSALMAMAKQLGAESVTLRDRLQRAEELKAQGRLDEASLLADEVSAYGKSVVFSEIDQQMTELMRQITEARKEGVEVGQSEHLCEQGSNALHREDLTSAFDLTLEARRSLNEVVATHHGLKDLLEEAEAMMAEAKRSAVDVAEASEAVVRAGTLLRSGRYQETREGLERAEAILRRDAPSFILDAMLRRMSDMERMRDRLGYEGSEAQLKELGPFDASRLDDSLSALAKLKEGWEGEISASLDREIVACHKEVDKASSDGLSVGHVRQILLRGKDALNERKLAEALRAVELVRNELDQIAQADRRLNDTLALVEESLEQLREMGIEVKDATVLLEQARALRRTGNAPAAMDTVKRALDRSQTVARERTMALMGFAGGLTAERASWEDLSTARKLNEDIEEALRNRRYRHAHLLARSFHEELERVLQDKALAEEEVSKLESRLKEEAKAGLRPEPLQKALEKGRALMAQGRFVQALSTVSQARDELRSLSEMYESRLSEYNELRETLNSLEVLDQRKDHIEELLDQCWSALKEMKFEPASLYLRRARNGLNEFMTVRTNELLWEFNPLHDLIKRLKLQKRFSEEIAEIERTSVDGVASRDLNRLSRNVELVRAGMRDIFQEQREKVRRIIEKASRADKQTGRSWEIWADSEAQATKGDLWEAFNSLETAINVMGRTTGETPEQLSRQLSEMLERANGYGIELQGTQRTYAEALEAQREGKSPLGLLKKACEVSRKEVRATYPDITAELEFVGDAKEGSPLDVVVHLRNDAKHDARNVRAFIFGDADVKGMVEAEVLKAGQGTKGRITIVPMHPGLLSLGISVKCKPLLTEEDVLYDSKFDLDVK